MLVLGTGGSLAATRQAATSPLASFCPAAAVTGATVHVYGSGFTGAKWFEIGLLHVPFHVVNDGHATITVPANAVSGQLGFLDAAGNGHQSASTFYVIPHVTSFSPTHGTISTPITVRGTGFGLSTDLVRVTMGTEIRSFRPVSSSTMRFTPSNHGGPIALSLNGYSSDTTAASFTLEPSFNSPVQFDSSALPRGGALLIWGAGFDDTSSVKFGSVPASYTVAADGRSIETTVPAGALSAPITVTTPYGKIVSRRFGVQPTIDEPSSGPLGEGVAGSTLVLTGNAFTGTTSVKVGIVAAPFKVLSDTSISLTIPTTATTNRIAVTNAGGETMSARLFVVVPKISSFSPTSARVGDTVTLKGSGFGSSPEFRDLRVGGVPAGPVTWRSPNELRFVVPVHVRTGKVSIAVQWGDTAQSPASLTITPNVLGYDRSSYRAGDVVTIEGNHLEGASAVSFGKVPATSFTVADDGDAISTSVPPGALTGTVSVTTPSGVFTGPTLHVVPTIDALPASHGPTGSILAVTGKTFTGVTRVTVGGVSASFKVMSPTSLTATIPSTAVSGHLAVTNAGGTTTSDDGYVVDPRITGISPTTAGAGKTVTLTGTGFGASGEARDVEVGGVPATSTTWVSPTSVRFVVAPGSRTGTVTIDVSGGPVTASAPRTLTVPPSVAGYDRAMYQAGDAVTIQGSALDGATSLKFGSVLVTSGFVVAGDGASIAATVPANAVTAAVTVVTPSGSVAGPSLHVVPTITGLSPTDAAIGSTITLTGNTFTGTSSVRFGAATASFHVVSPTTLTAVVPSSAATGHVTVTNAGGTTASTQTFAPHPRLTGLSPSNGATGDTVTLTGNGLDALTNVTFAGLSGPLPATVVSATPTAARVIVPDSAVPGLVTVASAAGTATSTTSFRVTFSLTSLQYIDAPFGTDETLHGIGLTGAGGPSFNGYYVGGQNWTVIADTAMTVNIPLNFYVDMSGPVTVGKGSKTVRLAQDFSLLRIASASPQAPAAGSTLTLHGSGFLPAHDVRFAVYPHNADVTSFTVNGDGTTLGVEVPDGFIGGSVDVVLDNGLSAQILIDGEYISSLSPASGAPGDTVTINGSGFEGNNVHVSFNGTPATTFARNSADKITATVPAGATTGPVTVTAEGGTATSKSDFTVTG